MIQTIRVTVEAKHTWFKSRRKVLVRLMWSVQQRHAAKLPRTCCHMQSWKIVRQPQTAQNVFKLSLFKRQLGRQRYQTCSVQGASKLTIKLELNWISEAMGQNWVYQLKTIENNVQELKNKKTAEICLFGRCAFWPAALSHRFITWWKQTVPAVSLVPARCPRLQPVT